MENASKALIIAGAILVSILLISLGIIVFNSSDGATDQVNSTRDALSEGSKKGAESVSSEMGKILTRYE